MFFMIQRNNLTPKTSSTSSLKKNILVVNITNTTAFCNKAWKTIYHIWWTMYKFGPRLPVVKTFGFQCRYIWKGMLSANIRQLVTILTDGSCFEEALQPSVSQWQTCATTNEQSCSCRRFFFLQGNNKIGSWWRYVDSPKMVHRCLETWG